MIFLSRRLLAEMETAAVAAFPEECCGLLVGQDVGDGDDIRLTRVVSAHNRAPRPRVAFEIDPQLWLDLRNQLADGADRIAGLYHSHPGGGTAPSPRDRAAAWDLAGTDAPLVWLVLARDADGAGASRAWLRRPGAASFTAAALRIEADA